MHFLLASNIVNNSHTSEKYSPSTSFPSLQKGGDGLLAWIIVSIALPSRLEAPLELMKVSRGSQRSFNLEHKHSLSIDV